MRQGKVVDVCCGVPPSLAVIECQATDRNAAMIAAHATGGYSYQQIADYFGVYFTTVGKIVRDGRGSMIVDMTPMFHDLILTMKIGLARRAGRSLI